MHPILRKLFVSAATALALPLVASATPLTLNYTISGTSTYTYDFNLVLDNHDASWVAGQNFNWITFADTQNSVSPMADFVGNMAFMPQAGFTGYTTSGGWHNGPTLLDITNIGGGGWVPTAVGADLHWSGTSNAYLGQGQLLWSNLLGNHTNANFQVAHMGAVVAVPEPETYGMLLAGIAMLGVVARRKSGAKA